VRLIALLLGCSQVDPEFAGERANALCAWHARCDTLEIAGWTSEDACRADLRAAAELLDPGTCERWSPTAAEACLAAYAEATCDTPPDLEPCLAVCG